MEPIIVLYVLAVISNVVTVDVLRHSLPLVRKKRQLLESLFGSNSFNSAGQNNNLFSPSNGIGSLLQPQPSVGQEFNLFGNSNAAPVNNLLQPQPSALSAGLEQCPVLSILGEILDGFGGGSLFPKPVQTRPLFPLTNPVVQQPPSAFDRFATNRILQDQTPIGKRSESVRPLHSLQPSTFIPMGRYLVDLGQNFDRLVFHDMEKNNSPLYGSWTSKGAIWKDGNIRIVDSDHINVLGAAVNKNRGFSIPFDNLVTNKLTHQKHQYHFFQQ